MTHIDSAGSACPGAGGLLELLVFEVGGEAFALETGLVREVRPAAPGVADAADAADGADGGDGGDGGVIDLRARFGFPACVGEQRLLVVQSGAGSVGLLVDRIREVLRLSNEMVTPAPAAPGEREAPTAQSSDRWHGVEAGLLSGVVALDDGLVLILAPQALGADERWRRAA